jgi:rubrerythrin
MDSQEYREEGNDSGLTLGELDRDGAILEGIDRVYKGSRTDLLAKAALGSGVLLAALSTPPEAEAAANELDMLNFDLNFERLQSTFYTETERIGTIRQMPSRMQLWSRTLGAHELAHVRILKTVLGPKAVKRPTFNFRGVTDDPEKFVRTAVAMEDLTVALLAGQAPRFTNRQLTAAVFSLLTVEARHAAWARRIRGYLPVATAFDQPKPLSEVRRIVANTRFIAARPRTTARRSPRFTG